ncbi:hypothetical protein ACN6K4_001517 [Streptomyces hayashii]|uniref:hypothetical protein n=1 Tax=Streptomyces hayashii TaxID=2839966 RepID=UPI00403D504B
MVTLRLALIAAAIWRGRTAILEEASYLLYATFGFGYGIYELAVNDPATWHVRPAAIAFWVVPWLDWVTVPVLSMLMFLIFGLLWDALWMAVAHASRHITARVAPLSAAAVLITVLLPPTYWKAYLHDVREAFQYADGPEETPRTVAASFLRALPATLFQEWMDLIASVAFFAWSLLAAAGRKIRTLEGWKGHLFWALVFAVLVHPVMYLVTYVLWLYHRELPWEFYFPMY